MRTSCSRPLPGLAFACAALALPLATGSSAQAASKSHQCGNGSKTQLLYPWVSSLQGVSAAKACSTIVALGRSVSGGSFPSLESLITCSPAPVDADGVTTGPGKATLKRTTFHGWALTYTSTAGLKLAKGSASFRAGQQDFGCY